MQRDRIARSAVPNAVHSTGTCPLSAPAFTQVALESSEPNGIHGALDRTSRSVAAPVSLYVLSSVNSQRLRAGPQNLQATRYVSVRGAEMGLRRSFTQVCVYKRARTLARGAMSEHSHSSTHQASLSLSCCARKATSRTAGVGSSR